MYETAHDILSLTYDRVSAQNMCAQEHSRRLAERELYWKRPRPADCWHGFCSPGRRYGIVGEFPVIARAEQPFDQPSYALPPAAVVAHVGTDPVRELTRSEAALTIVPVLETAKWVERRGWFGPLE